MNRKEAVREYKERKIPRGIFAVRCSATGAEWVGASPNLEAARNSAWFQLKMGGHRNKELQAEWNGHGEAAFEFEILETLEEDVSPMVLRDVLTERKRHWAGERNARVLL